MGNDPLFMNKIAGAILSAGLLAMLTGFAAHMLYHPKELAGPAFVIAAGEPKTETTQAEAPAGPEPILALLASASADDGEKLSKKCTACHSFTSGGPNKVGPNLWNIVGGKPASVDGYSYSSAMKAMEVEWGYEELNQFLYKPKDFVKGTKMSFAGFKKASDRAAMVAYLRSLSDNPKPLP
jgi:cytochrome c